MAAWEWDPRAMDGAGLGVADQLTARRAVRVRSRRRMWIKGCFDPAGEVSTDEDTAGEVSTDGQRK